MKKHLLWMAAGTIALSACTSTEVLDESGIQSNAIGFENVIKKSTRADEAINGDLSLKNFDMFSVYGYYTKEGKESHAVAVFNGDEVTQTTVTDEDGTKKASWTYAQTRYWIPGATYNFYAYSCADVALTDDNKGKPVFDVRSTDYQDLNKRSLKINGYVCDETHQHDLICAFKEGETCPDNAYNTKVSLKFKHALCKVSAEFVNDFPTGYEITVSDVKILDFYGKADYEIREDTWAGHEYTASKELAMAVEEGKNTIASTVDVEKEESVPTASLFMLPATYDGEHTVSISFRLKASQNGDDFLDRTIKGTWQPKWNSGSAYKYIIHIDGNTAQLKPIVFEATQSIEDAKDWENNITEDMTFDII